MGPFKRSHWANMVVCAMSTTWATTSCGRLGYDFISTNGLPSNGNPSQQDTNSVAGPNGLPQNTIAPASCFNGIQDGGETQVDCGGSCAACPNPALARVLLSKASAPGRYVTQSAAYHATRRTMMAYGGIDIWGNIFSGGLREYDGATWTELTGTTAPSGRVGHGMVYDRARDVLVLFGGLVGQDVPLSSGSASNELWEWSATTGWQQRIVAGGPSARQDHFMVYDELRHRTIVFAGVDTANQVLSDVYEYDGAQWFGPFTPLTRPTPRRTDISSAAFVGSLAAYAPARNKTFFLGGLSTPSGNASGSLNDAWTWDGTSWTEVCISCNTLPRADAGVAYDPASGFVFAAGGWSGVTNGEIGGIVALQSDGTFSAYENTFPSRDSIAIAYDENRNVIVLSGGNGPACQAPPGGPPYDANCGDTFELK